MCKQSPNFISQPKKNVSNFYLFQKISVMSLVCLSVILPVCLFVRLSGCESVVSRLSVVPPNVSCLLLSCLRVCLPAVLPASLSVMPLFCLSVILSIHLLVRLSSIHIFMLQSYLPLYLPSIFPQNVPYYGQACFYNIVFNVHG